MVGLALHLYLWQCNIINNINIININNTNIININNINIININNNNYYY